VKILETLITDDLSDSKSRRLLAWALAKLGRHHEAVRHYQQLTEAAPEDLDAPLGLAEGLISLQRYADAIPILRLAAEREPRNPDVQHLLGGAYTETRRIERCVGRLPTCVGS
jgi:hypothetical protein